MNVKLLRKIKRHILAEPKRLDMDLYVVHKDEDAGYKFPKCGTIACIAGWAVVLSDKKRVRYDDIQSRARTLLGVDYGQATKLFHDSYWPPEFRDRLLTAPSQTLEHAQIIAQRIDHFIKTKGAE